jgi:acyl carrier protein
MNEHEILVKLEKSFRKVFDNEYLILKKSMTASDVDNWNSLNHMILVSEIESAFSIRFKLKELNKMHNVGDMIDIIICKL